MTSLADAPAVGGTLKNSRKKGPKESSFLRKLRDEVVKRSQTTSYYTKKNRIEGETAILLAQLSLLVGGSPSLDSLVLTALKNSLSAKDKEVLQAFADQDVEKELERLFEVRRLRTGE